MAEYSKELDSISIDLKKQLTGPQLATFIQNETRWQHYIQSERKHYQSMKAVQGTVGSIGYLTDIVEIIKARIRILLRQLA